MKKNNHMKKVLAYVKHDIMPISDSELNDEIKRLSTTILGELEELTERNLGKAINVLILTLSVVTHMKKDMNIDSICFALKESYKSIIIKEKK